MSNQRVLITGSSGFVGRALHDGFLHKGWDVVGLGRRSVALEGYRQHDLTCPVPESFGDFDVVIHAAALSSPWGSKRQFEQNNVHSTRLLLDRCLRRGSPRFIYISSGSVYSRFANQLDITEETPQAETPINHYAASKQRAERLVKGYPGQWVIIRPKAVFGPGDTVLFPRVLAAARSGRLPRLVGRDGPAMGELIYIDNLVDCVVKAAQMPDIQGDFNLTNNQPVVLIDFLADALAQLSIQLPEKEVPASRVMLVASGLELFYKVFIPWREPPITRFGIHAFAYATTFDVTKMLSTFGPPSITLEEGVERFVKWYRQRPMPT